MLAPRAARILRPQVLRTLCARGVGTAAASKSTARRHVWRFLFGVGCATAGATLADLAGVRQWAPVIHAEGPLLVADPSVKGEFRPLPRAAAVLDPGLTRTHPPLPVERATSTPFPTRMHPVSMPSTPLTLLGVGVRTVSFLRVKVYAAGFYLDEDTLARLGSVPGWSVSPGGTSGCAAQRLIMDLLDAQSFTATHLLTAPADPTQQTGEKLFETLLDGPVSCAIRIGPWLSFISWIDSW